MPEIRKIGAALQGYEPKLVPAAAPRAAVAMVLRPSPTGPEVLFIERASKDGDPWSGHMAFPGGRSEAADPSLAHTAERETLEEVGLSLGGVDPIGRLDDLQGRHAGRRNGMVISAFVYRSDAPQVLTLETSEVREAFWFPLAELRNPERHVHKSFRETGSMRFPGIVVGDPERHIVWGLTYRFLEVFHEVLGRPLPGRWEGLAELARGSAEAGGASD
jgi:8-oxo-dGTP pyrophosphatase MutT (NUDIX family)